jgi:hypothetical protein
MLSTSTLITRIRGEYMTMPGLKLTREQACRLWAVDDDTCSAALEALIDEGFLHRTGTGKFIALPRPGGAAIRVTELSRTDGPVRCPHCQKLNTIEPHSGELGASGVSFRCVACRRPISFTALSA